MSNNSLKPIHDCFDLNAHVKRTIAKTSERYSSVLSDAVSTIEQLEVKNKEGIGAQKMVAKPSSNTAGKITALDTKNVPEIPHIDITIKPESSNSITFNERNIEEWSHLLFPHAYTKNLDKKRTIKIGDRYVVIRPLTGSKAFTHRTYKTFLALVILWHKEPHPDGDVEGFLNDIVRIKKQSAKSGKNRDKVYEDLDCLSGTAIDWVRSFDVNGVPTSLKRVHLITNFQYDRGATNKDGSTFNRKFKCKLNANIISRIKDKQINPVAYDSMNQISSDMASIYFNYIDTKIATKNDDKPWEWSSKNFFEELGFLDNPKYKHKSNRKSTVYQIATQIDGKILSSGSTLRATAVPTKDKKDYKIRHFVDINPHNFNTKKTYPVVNTDSDYVVYLADEIADVVGQKDANFSWYMKVARHYSETFIFRVLGTYKDKKARGTTPIDDSGAYFTYLVHTTAHNTGTEWIGGCDHTCRYRKENQLLSDNPQ